MLNVILVAGAGIVIAGGIVMVFLKSRDADRSDSVPQNVLTRINSEYRDLR